jgi:hypothetical protein
MALCQCLAQSVTPDGFDATAQAHAVLLLGGTAPSAQPLLTKYSTLEPKLYQVGAFVALLRVRLRAVHVPSTAAIEHMKAASDPAVLW